MKKFAGLLVGIMVVLAVSIVFAYAPVYTNQITIAWDAVTTLATGDPWVSIGDSIAYDVVIKKLPAGTEQMIGRTSNLQMTITIPAQGEWAVGLRAVRIFPDGTEVPSATTWSTESAGTPNPFSVMYVIPLAPVKNLRH